MTVLRFRLSMLKTLGRNGFWIPKNSHVEKIRHEFPGVFAGLIAGGAVPEWALYLAWTFLVTWREFLVDLRGSK